MTMANIKTYSVLIAWNDKDQEQGEFGTVVKAADPAEAEHKAREEMRASHEENHGGEGAEEYEHQGFDGSITFGGSLLNIAEGAIWEAASLEEALRDILLSADANDGGSLANAMEAARTVLARIDNMGA